MQFSRQQKATIACGVWSSLVSYPAALAAMEMVEGCGGVVPLTCSLAYSVIKVDPVRCESQYKNRMTQMVEVGRYYQT
jgi:hypothetical protein